MARNQVLATQADISRTLTGGTGALNKHHNWLQREINTWESEQLIDPTQAEGLRGRYPATREIAWGRLIFTSAGAAIFGLGVILFFAYNWSAIPKYFKLSILIGSVILVHSLAFWLNWRDPRQHAISDGLHTLGTMLFGASIWLVAQIYHLDSHYPTALLVWGLGALAMAWALPSIAQGVIALLLFSLWSVSEAFDFYHASWSGSVLIAFALLPLAWWQRSRALLLLALLGLLLQLVLTLLTLNLQAAFYFPLLSASLLLALSRLTQQSAFPGAATIMRFIGLLIYLTLLFILSFQLPDLPYSSPTRFIGNGKPAAEQASDWLHHAVILVPLILSLLLWLFVFTRADRRAVNWAGLTDDLLIVLITLLIPVAYWQLYLQWKAEWLLVLSFNAVFFLHALLMISHGTQTVRIRFVLAGCAMLATLLSIRFTDLFDSLLIRSVLFLALGAGLFWIGYFYNRKKDQAEKKGAAHA